MEITRQNIKDAGITQKELADAVGVKQPAIAYYKANEPLPERYQYLLRFGSKEAKSIRRKTIKHLKSINHDV